MKELQVLRNDEVLVPNVVLADSYLKRLVGLLRHKTLDNEHGLMLNYCNEVHTIGMRFSIDVVFLSKEGEILYIEHNMKPYRIGKVIKNAFWVFEIKSGMADELKLKTKEKLTWKVK